MPTPTASSQAGPFASGLSTVGYRLYSADGLTPVAARTTTGVHEAGTSGNYGVAAITLPAYDTEYMVVWDDGRTPPLYGSPDRVVAWSVLYSTPVAFTPLTNTQFQTLVGGVPTEGGLTLRQTVAQTLNASVAKLSGVPAVGTGGTVHIRDVSDARDAFVITVDGTGNRTGLTQTPPA